MDTQVLVIGAGPVGLTVAAELARYGIAVRIVDKAKDPTDKSKALVIWPRTLELLDRLGCGEAFVAAGLKATGAVIEAHGRPIVHLDFTGTDSPFRFTLMIPQSETERLLGEQAERLGLHVERQVEAVRIEQQAEKVLVALRGADGSVEDLAVDWLIGCDGAHSTTRHSLGMEFPGFALPSDWMLADVHLAGIADAPEIRTFVGRDGALVLFPIAPGRYRVIANVGLVEQDILRPDPTLAEVQQLLDIRGPGGITASNPIWMSNFRINERKVQDYRSGRIFLAGDAAHVHSPAGGQGMNTGMQDAFNLAWKLALVCNGTCAAEPLLTSYSAERSPVGAQVLAETGRLTTIATTTNPVTQELRNAVAHVLGGLSPVRDAVAKRATELSIGYPESPLTRRGPHGVRGPHPGERAAPRPAEPPVGAGDRPRFALFAAASQETTDLLRAFPDLLEAQIRSPFAPDAMWLVRPDGYVATVARPGEAQAIAGYLRALSNSVAG